MISDLRVSEVLSLLGRCKLVDPQPFVIQGPGLFLPDHCTASATHHIVLSVVCACHVIFTTCACAWICSDEHDTCLRQCAIPGAARLAKISWAHQSEKQAGCTLNCTSHHKRWQVLHLALSQTPACAALARQGRCQGRPLWSTVVASKGSMMHSDCRQRQNEAHAKDIGSNEACDNLHARVLNGATPSPQWFVTFPTCFAGPCMLLGLCEGLQ